MSTETLNQALAANTPAIFGAGTRFLISQAPGPLTIVARQLGNANSPRTFSGVEAGFKFSAASDADGFDTLTITCATAGNLTITLGDDDVTFVNAVTVVGTITAETKPTGATTDHADVAVAAGATDATIGANVDRRRLIVGNLSTSPGSLRLRAHGSDAGGMEIQPGMYETIECSDARDVYNPGAAGITYWWQEES